jgi:hypothetical protein
MEIPEFEIENLPPDFNAEIPEVVTPPVTPETPVVPRPTEGGGGGSAGGVVVPPPVLLLLLLLHLLHQKHQQTK